MADEAVLANYGNGWVAADHGTDFTTPTAANILYRASYTDVQFDLTSLGFSGGARQSAKFDLGAQLPSFLQITGGFEFASSPTDNDGTVDAYIGWSNNSTAANGNPGGLGGSDAALTDTIGILSQLQFIGSIAPRAAGWNAGRMGGPFVPLARYAILVVVNNVGTALIADANETHVVIDGLVYQPGT